MNKHFERYTLINYNIVLFKEHYFEDCNSVNCTGLIGLIQRGKVDAAEAGFQDSILDTKSW